MATTARTLPAAGPVVRGPSVRRLAGEALWGLDAARLLVGLPRLALRLRGVRPRDVLVLPGWLAGDVSTAVLRRALAHDGHRVSGWGRGRNRGDIEANVRAVTAAVTRRAAAVGAPLDLVGQSLGGVVARVVAARAPDAVRRIITLGTPLHGPTGTAFQLFFEATTTPPAPPPVPTTVVWSRRDGIVGWRAQIDDDNPWAEHVEVRSRHLGMAVDPDVLRLVRDRVAGPAGAPLRVGAGVTRVDRSPSGDPAGERNGPADERGAAR